MYADVFWDMKLHQFLRSSLALLARAYKLHIGETGGGGGGYFIKLFFLINNKNVNGQFFFVIGGKLLSMTQFCFINANDKSQSRLLYILIVVIEPNNKILSSA